MSMKNNQITRSVVYCNTRNSLSWKNLLKGQNQSKQASLSKKAEVKLSLWPLIMKAILAKQDLVKDPFCFYGATAADYDREKFEALHQEIQAYFSNAQLMKPVFTNPQPGKRCIVRSDTTSWDRAVIESLMIAPRSYQVKCFLVDKMKTKMVSSNRVLDSPSWIWDLPPRGKSFCLHGIDPLRLHTDYSKDKVDLKVSMRWSIAAISYFKDMIEQCGNFGIAEIIDVSDNETYYIKLYVKDSNTNTPVCVNDDLVDKRFAEFASTEEDKTGTSNSAASFTSQFLEENIPSTKQEASEAMKRELEKEMNDFMSIVEDFSNNNEQSEAELSCSSSDSMLNNRLPKISEMFGLSSKPVKPSFVSSKPDCNLPNGYTENNRFSLNSQSSEDLAPLTQLSSDEFAVTKPVKFAQSKDSARSMSSSCDVLADLTSSAVALIKKSPQPAKPLAGSGRGMILKNLINSFASLSNPPPIQRSISNLSSLSISVSSRSNTTEENYQDLLANNLHNKKNKKAYFKLLAEIHSYQLNEHFSAKLDNITANVEPLLENISFAKKVMQLEKLLDEIKQHHKRATPMSATNNDLPLLSSPMEKIKSCKTIVNNAQPKTDDKKKRMETGKEKGFFSSAMTLIKSRQETSGVILVKGLDPPNPISLFCDAPFPNFMISTMQAMKYRGPYYLQAYAWSAILSKRNVIGLGPVGGGKTLAYVAPIVSMLLKDCSQVRKDTLTMVQAKYLQVQSPPVVVLCSSWRNVKVVVSYFNRFLEHPSNDLANVHNIVGITGGPDAEKANAVNLLSGCSVLVCSPFTFLRLFEEKQLSLARLEQLVFDDFHILVEEFTLQVRLIMQAWLDTLNDPDRPFIPQFKPQIMCFGVQWTSGVESFMETFMKRPLLYISDPLEASVYGQVKHRVEMLKDHFVFDHVIALLRSNWEERSGGVAVFVNSVARMKELSAAFNKLCYPTLEVHSGMSDYELQLVQQSSEEISTAPVMVICDSVLSIIDLDTIEVAIHYDFPADSHTLGMRLSLLRSFYKIKEIDKSTTRNPRSFLIVTEKDLQSCSWLVTFLSRLSNPAHRQLKLLSEKAVECREACKTRSPLCPCLKAYGRCRDVNVCTYRHWLSDKLDRPNSDPKYAEIPTSGQVRILITSVKNATLFYGRLVMHLANDRDPPTAYPNIFQDLCEKLNSFYSENGQKLPNRPVLEQMCAYKEFEQHFRVQVISTAADKFKNTKTVCWETPAGVTKARVYFVDTGAFRVVNVDDLLVLDLQFEETPFQAIAVRSCGTKPIDQDTEWLFTVNKLVHDLIYEKLVEGYIQHALNHTIWLKPLLIRSKLPITGKYITECDVVDELLRSKLAEKAPNHMDIFLRQQTRGQVNQSTSANSNPSDNNNKLTAQPSPSESVSTGSTMSKQSRPNSALGNIKVSEKGDASATTLSAISNVRNSSSNLQTQEVKSSAGSSLRAEQPNTIHVDSHGDCHGFDELPPPLASVPFVREKKAIESTPRNGGAITSGYASETYIDTSDSEYQPNRPERFRRKPKTSPPKRFNKHTRKTSPRAFKQFADCSQLSTDHEVESSSTLSDNSAVSSSLLLSDDTISENHVLSDDSLTPTRFSLVSELRKRSSNESTPTNRHLLSSSRGERNSSFLKRSPKYSNERPSKALSNFSVSQTPHCSSTISPMPPLSSSNETSSITAERKTISTNQSSFIHGVKTTPQHDRSEFSAKEMESESFSPLNDKEDLPPIGDINGKGIIYPYYVQLLYTDNVSVRLHTCENIYIQSSENYGLVSKIDLQSLNKALLQSRNNRETALLISTMMTLAGSFVPVEEFINLPDIIERFCVRNLPKTSDLPSKIMCFSMFVLNDLVEKYPEQICDLTNALVTYLELVCSDVSLNKSMIPVLEKILKLLERISQIARQSFMNGNQDRLVAVLSILPSNSATDELRKQLFDTVMDESVDDSRQEVNSTRVSSEVSSKTNEKPKSISATKKIYDPLNYDRFNNIDTDTDSCRSRPYTPIPVRFDFESSSSITETDTDTDFLPGM